MINGNLYQNKEKADIVKRVFNMFGKGLYTQGQIRNILAKEDIKLTPTQIFYMLRNSVYCGKMFSPSLHDTYIIGKHEPIISEELFDKVQCILNDKDKLTTSDTIVNPLFPLKQFVICPNCGCPITASSSTGRKNKKYAYYRQNNNSK